MSTQVTTIVRWTARISSLVSIGLLAAFLFGEDGLTLQLEMAEWLGLLFFPGGVIIGMILGWWREGWGGMVVLVSLAAFYVEQFLLGGRIPGGPWFLIFTLPGLLFGVSWLLARQSDDELHPPMHA